MQKDAVTDSVSREINCPFQVPIIIMRKTFLTALQEVYFISRITQLINATVKPSGWAKGHQQVHVPKRILSIQYALRGFILYSFLNGQEFL